MVGVVEEEESRGNKGDKEKEDKGTGDIESPPPLSGLSFWQLMIFFHRIKKGKTPVYSGLSLLCLPC